MKADVGAAEDEETPGLNPVPGLGVGVDELGLGGPPNPANAAGAAGGAGAFDEDGPNKDGVDEGVLTPFNIDPFVGFWLPSYSF